MQRVRTLQGIAGGRKALVTGAASGFGLSVAERLADAGARVALADIDAAAISNAAARLGSKALSIEMDVADAESVRLGVRSAAAQMGGLDTVVNSAGICRIRKLDEIPEDEWDLVLDINLKGTFLVSQAAAPYLRAAGTGRGRIVNISSVAGKNGPALLAPYASAKAGLKGLTESLAAELLRYGVLVNAVLPTSTPETRMGRELVQRKLDLEWEATAADVVSGLAQGTVLGRAPAISDTVDLIMFLISDGAAFITGQAIVVDGGSSLVRPPQGDSDLVAAAGAVEPSQGRPVPKGAGAAQRSPAGGGSR